MKKIKLSPQAREIPYVPSVERRDYLPDEKSFIWALNDMQWRPPYLQDILHYHNCMEIGVCVEGQGSIAIGPDQSMLPFSQGTAVIIPAGLAHFQQNAGSPATRWRYVALDEKRLLNEIPKNCRESVSRLISNARRTGLYTENSDIAGRIGYLIETMIEARRRHGDGAQGEIEALLVLLLVLASRETGEEGTKALSDPLGMRMIEPALLYVSENYSKPIRVGDLAGACALSESYFRKVFRRLMGLSPLEYTNRHRIYRAMHLLHVTSSSIQSISVSCGFPSIATFERNFIRCSGQTPSTWRSAGSPWHKMG